ILERIGGLARDGCGCDAWPGARWPNLGIPAPGLALVPRERTQPRTDLPDALDPIFADGAAARRQPRISPGARAGPASRLAAAPCRVACRVRAWGRTCRAARRA